MCRIHSRFLVEARSSGPMQDETRSVLQLAKREAQSATRHNINHNYRTCCHLKLLTMEFAQKLGRKAKIQMLKSEKDELKSKYEELKHQHEVYMALKGDRTDIQNIIAANTASITLYESKINNPMPSAPTEQQNYNAQVLNTIKRCNEDLANILASISRNSGEITEEIFAKVCVPTSIT